MVVLGMYSGMGKAQIQNVVNAVRTLNPSIKLGQYTILNEQRNTAVAGDSDYAAVNALNGNGWFVRDATTGSLVNWTSAFNNWSVNVTSWAPTDAQGRHWPQFKAQNDTDGLFGGITGIDYVFVDNVFFQPRVTADWKRIGSNQAPNDPAIQTAYRQGMSDFWTSLRALNPSLKIIGNADSDLSYPEYSQKIEGAFMECMIGKSWSLETWAGWNSMMARYRGALKNTKAPHDVILQTCGATADPALMRYGMASALLEDGFSAYTLNTDPTPPLFDEYNAPLGTATEVPPTAPVNSAGIWMRRYSNGLVLVNPTKVAASIDIGTGYKHLSGTQDPVVNNGLAERVVTLPPRSGLFMVKQ
jgi:hypothetical protein